MLVQSMGIFCFVNSASHNFAIRLLSNSGREVRTRFDQHISLGTVLPTTPTNHACMLKLPP